MILLILSFPLFISLGGPELNYIYFPVLVLMMIFLAALCESKFVLKHGNLSILVLMLLLMFISGVSLLEIRYSFPVAFFLTSAIFLVVSDSLPEEFNRKWIAFVSVFYAVFCLYLLTLTAPADDRFSGFSDSATTFTVFITFITIVTIFQQSSKLLSIAIYCATVYLIILSETRLNLAFILLLPFLVFFASKRRMRIIILVMAVLALNLTYPLYSYLMKTTDIISYRYEGSFDPSFVTRNHFQNIVLNSWSNASFPEKLFGQGTEYSRLLILQADGEDYLPHNDFLRLLNDHGIVGFAIFMMLIILLGVRNKTTFCLTLLYLLSFYHNMVFNFFLLFGILTFLNQRDRQSQAVPVSES